MVIRSKKSPFTKLTHYYLRKLLAMWWHLLLPVGLVIFVLITYLFLPDQGGLDFSGGWRQIYGYFWLISWVQLFFMYATMTNLIHRLVEGTAPGFFEWGFKKGKNREDNLLITYLPNATRLQIFRAKLLVLGGVFGVINLLLTTLPIFFFLWTTNCPAPWIFAFLLLNGLVFPLINFLLLVPVFFLNKMIITFSYFGILLVGWQLLISFLRQKFLHHALLISGLTLPAALLISSSLLVLAWRTFRRADLS